MDPVALELMEWSLAGNPAPPPHAVKIAMLRSFIERSAYRVFIETGTYLGATTEEIAKTGVRVITIELSESLHRTAVQRFADVPNVACLLGDSSKVLPGLLADLKEPAVLWLDGHYSDGITAQGDRATPLVEELFFVLHHEVKQHVILIDDVRLFDGVTYPTVDWVEQFVRLYLPDHQSDVRHDIFRARPKVLGF